MPPTVVSPLPPPHAPSGRRRPLAAGDLDLLVAVHRRLACEPGIRAGVVGLARARLCADGPPSADRLAGMLVDHLRAVRAERACSGMPEGRRYA